MMYGAIATVDTARLAEVDPDRTTSTCRMRISGFGTCTFFHRKGYRALDTVRSARTAAQRTRYPPYTPAPKLPVSAIKTSLTEYTVYSTSERQYLQPSRPSVVARPRFSAERAMSTLFTAFEGDGADQAAVTAVLTGHNSDQRQEIKRLYASTHDADLREVIFEELIGDYRDICLALITDDLTFDVESIMKMLGVRTVSDGGGGYFNKWWPVRML